ILLEDPTSAKATTLGPWLYGLKRMGFIKALTHAVRRSAAIIAPSSYTKGSILNHFDVSPEKIHVVYEGVSLLNNRLAQPSVIPAIAQQPYFLYVGSAYPHKNLESLLHAFSFFVQEHPEVTLVLVGRDDSFYKKLHQEVIEIGIPEERVVFPGFVPDAALASLYEHAALYLYPSRIEGFGLPPLEAMQFGTPVAAARSSSLPEVLGDAAVYFDPDNIEEMVEVMEKSLTAKIDKAKGQAQVKKYSWKKMAQETLELYEQFGG
ncbi:MAG: glycosyltransferase family 1 protein, partial [Sedimentisphaerales bacterium]|nr:glycosyltransferase family 1 protein [Sedimentisphaerales bacterium]